MFTCERSPIDVSGLFFVGIRWEQHLDKITPGTSWVSGRERSGIGLRSFHFSVELVALEATYGDVSYSQDMPAAPYCSSNVRPLCRMTKKHGKCLHLKR